MMKLKKIFFKDENKEDANIVDEKNYYASQWQLMYKKLLKHKLARISAIILIFFYIHVIFGGFIAPTNIDDFSSDFMDAPPTKIHFVSEDGKFSLQPFVYGLKSERDPETFRKVYVENKDEKYKVKLFVKGAEYKLLGFIKSDVHLFGVEKPGKIFLFGTDGLGRDLYSRIIYGAQVSLTIPILGVAISFIIGIILGGISGYFGGKVDSFIQRLIEIIRSFPALPLWMALAAAIPPRIPMIQMYLYIVIILSFIQWTGLARIVRSQFITLRNQDYVMAAKIAGVSDFKIITSHLIPGIMSYLIVEMTLGIPTMILGETSMSFLGLGIIPPATSWGVLLQEAQKIQNVAICPWKLIPLLFVIIAVIAFNFLGDGLRDAADPYK